MPQINLTSIMQKLVKAATNDGRLEILAYNKVVRRVESNKKNLIKEFEDHEITKEILAGPEAGSNFLSEGNLNSFIGFHGGQAEEQVSAVKDLLKNEVRARRFAVKKTPKRNGVIFHFEVEVPFLKNIWALTPYPNPPPGNVERGGSWMDDIETRGVGGFEYYLYLFASGKTSPKSRSGTGLQTSGEKTHGHKIHSGGMGRRDYMKELLDNFRKQLEI